MKRIPHVLFAIALIFGLSDAALYACGAKFLVSGRASGPGLNAMIANTIPTSILFYWQQGMIPPSTSMPARALIVPPAPPPRLRTSRLRSTVRWSPARRSMKPPSSSPPLASIG